MPYALYLEKLSVARREGALKDQSGAFSSETFVASLTSGRFWEGLDTEDIPPLLLCAFRDTEDELRLICIGSGARGRAEEMLPLPCTSTGPAGSSGVSNILDRRRRRSSSIFPSDP